MVFEMLLSQMVADNSRGLGMGTRELSVSLSLCVREREFGHLSPECLNQIRGHLSLKMAAQPNYWCPDLQSAP